MPPAQITADLASRGIKLSLTRRVLISTATTIFLLALAGSVVAALRAGVGTAAAGERDADGGDAGERHDGGLLHGVLLVFR